MKKQYINLILICLLHSCQEILTNNLINSFYLKVHTKGVPNGTKAYLKVNDNNTLISLDSSKIMNGEFHFEGYIDRPIVYGIYFEDSKEVIGVFMENDSIYIEANKDSLTNSKITGSKTHDDYLEFIKQSNNIISKMNHLYPVFQKARAENDADKLEEINAQMRAINEENTKFAIQYANQHPDSYISALALQSVLTVPTINKDTIAKIYNNFSDYVKKGDFAIEIAQYLISDQSLDSIINEK